MTWFFFFFFVSGFCSLLYEIVWLRLSMAQFGVTTALVSTVLSVFMAGLGLGSWASGLLLRRYGSRITFPALRLYAVTECLIGASAIVVPYGLSWGRSLLQSVSFSSSVAYYLGSGILVAITIIPWCACMGATIPVAMFAIRQRFRDESHRSFSYLYLANVLGAVLGATVPLLIIELLGFHGTLKVGAALNVLLAVVAVGLSSRQRETSAFFQTTSAELTGNVQDASSTLLWLLFGTGLTSMAIEVVWIREYTPYLGTLVYAFALILSVYLAATFLGSRIYRAWSRRHEQNLPRRHVWFLLGVSILLPLIFVDPRVQFRPAGESHLWLKLSCLIMGVGPFSAILGFLTPLLVDRWSQGDPDRAGRAYAVNVIGCILGPLLSGFFLLPLMSERWALYLFAAAWAIVGLAPNPGAPEGTADTWSNKIAYGTSLVVIIFALISRDFSDRFQPREVLRDHTATIIAAGTGREKRLRVNGVGITSLTPVTKMMAHFPLASLDHPPKDGLMICFGMGTTFRSLLSWNIFTTAVELVPSVPRVFGYFHSDGPELLRSPMANVVIDDGRRYLERTPQQYDLVTLDPPPPVEAAGSSMLYSKEFYVTIKQRLRPGGILQQWLPAGDNVVRASVARAIKESFPYVRVFGSVEGWGLHFLASDRPIPVRTPEGLVARMPEGAIRDMMEWGPQPTPQAQFAAVLGREVTPEQLIAEAPGVPALQDDRPENEYFLLRRSLPERWSQLVWKQGDEENAEKSQAALH